MAESAATMPASPPTFFAFANVRSISAPDLISATSLPLLLALVAEQVVQLDAGLHLRHNARLRPVLPYLAEHPKRSPIHRPAGRQRVQRHIHTGRRQLGGRETRCEPELGEIRKNRPACRILERAVVSDI